MREIKFRVWDKKNKEYVYDYTSQWIFENYGFYSHDLFEYEQYTGLKDMNGVEIYEGDVLADGKGENGIVKYCENVSAFLLYSEGISFWLNEGDATRKTQLQYTEIIGNIHEKQ